MIDEKKLINFISSKEFQMRIIRSPKSVQEILLEFIEEQPKIGEWIPCSERLPEENEEVICCFKSGIAKALVLFNCKFHGGVYVYEISDVIAWQPLPAAYAEESEE